MSVSLKLPLAATFVCVLLSGCGGGAAAPASPPPPPPVVHRAVVVVANAGARHMYLLSSATPGVTGPQLTPNALPMTPSTLSCTSVLPGTVGGVAEGVTFLSSADGDLYYVALATPGVVTKLADNVLQSFATNCTITADRSKIFWIADEGGGQVSLKVASWGNPAGATTLKGPWTTSSTTANNLWRAPATNATHFAFFGDADTYGSIELWSLRLTDGQLVKLTPAFAAGQSLAASNLSVRFNPASTTLYYRADQDVNDKFEVYAVDIASPGVTTKVNSALPAAGDVTRFTVSTTTGFIGLLADQVTDNEIHAFAVSPTNLGTMIDVTPPLVAGGSALATMTTAFGHFFFLADATVSGQPDLYHTNLNTGFAVAQRVNPQVVTNGSAGYAVIYSTNATRFYYVAAQDDANKFELYSASVGVYGSSVKLNNALPLGDSVIGDSYLSADTVMYVADQDGDGFYEVWSVPLDRSTGPIALSDEITGTVVTLYGTL